MSTLTDVLKEIYEPKIREQLNSETTTLRRVQKTSEGVQSEVGGKYVKFPIHVSRNAGIGARLEMEALPASGNQGTKSVQVGIRHLYGQIRMSGQTLRLAKTNAAAFTAALDLEMTGLKDDLAVDLNRQVYGNGTGYVATVTNVATGVSFSIKHNKWLQDGMIVDVYDSTGVTQKASARTVTGITATTVTISGANITSAVGDILVRTGSVGKLDLTVQREWTGLGAIVQSSGALYGLTHSTWVSTVDSNSGSNRALSETLITATVDGVREKGGRTSVLFTTLGVRRAYANLLQSQRRFTNTQDFKGGFSGLAFTTDQGDIPMVTDTFCPPNTIYGLQEDQLKWYRESDWSFMDFDGTMWDRVSGFDAYDATMFQYSELGTHRRNVHFRIEDVTEG
jgi:hypothetical protein